MAVQIPFATKLVETKNSASVQEDAFLMDLLQQCSIKDDEPNWLKDISQQAAAGIARLSIPTKKDEEWRFIDLSSLTATNFVAPSPVKVKEASVLPEAKNSRLVFVNGIYASDLSDVSGLPEGIYVGNLANAATNYPIEVYFAKQQIIQDAFTYLNTAGCEDIAVVWLSKNVVVETPIHLVFLSQAQDKPSFSQPRVLVVAEQGAELSLIEEYIGTGTYFTNGVTEIWVGENAGIKHTRIQREAEDSFHIGKTAVSQTRNSRYTLNELNFGGKLSRHSPEILQQGEHTETNLNGLTVASGEQVADTHSIIALTKPHGTTDQLHKCIVDDRAHTVFNGKVFVPKEAQLTNAAQLNRNLLLSSKARVDTKPELQITADNVKCSHGATVSQLEAEEIFYLRSRGLTEEDSRQLLIDAFAAEICDRLSLESLRTKIMQTVAQKTTN